MRLAILLALLGHEPQPTAEKLEFLRIQEAWIAQAVPKGRIDRALEPVVRALGAPRATVREAAWDICWAKRHALAPSLLMAERSLDPEIRCRAHEMVESLFWCTACNTTGKCQVCKGEIATICDKCDWRRSCPTCDGTADIRYKHAWVDGAYAEVPRALFSEYIGGAWCR